MSAGKSLRDIIDESDLSRAELAKKSGVSTYTIHFACKGKMSAATRSALARVLNVEPEQLGKVTLGTRPGTEIEEKSEKQEKKKNGNGNGHQKAQPAKTEEVESIAIAGPINLTLPSEIDDKQKDALVNALFKTRKGKGYSAAEVKQLEEWAETILTGSVQLDAILNGKAAVDVHEDTVRVVVAADK